MFSAKESIYEQRVKREQREGNLRRAESDFGYECGVIEIISMLV